MAPHVFYGEASRLFNCMLVSEPFAAERIGLRRWGGSELARGSAAWTSSPFEKHPRVLPDGGSPASHLDRVGVHRASRFAAIVDKGVQGLIARSCAMLRLEDFMLFNRQLGVLMCLDTVFPPEPDVMPQPNGLMSPSESEVPRCGLVTPPWPPRQTSQPEAEALQRLADRVLQELIRQGIVNE